MRGAFIVFEGCDRSGKTTQCKLLEQKLIAKNIAVKVISFPNRTTPVGEILNKFLTKQDSKHSLETLHLLFAINRYEMAEEINQLLENGTCVLVDRYRDSGIAYSIARGIKDWTWCKNVEKRLPKPDIIFFLQTSVLNLKNRNGFGEEIHETEIFQEKVADAYKLLLPSNIEKNRRTNWCCLNGDLSTNALRKQIYRTTHAKLKKIYYKII